MATEIERRFLVREVGFLQSLRGESIIQGYVSREPDSMTTRVRIRGSRATITLKSAPTGLDRDEYEYEIPLEDAQEILDTYCAGCRIEKTRYRVEYAQHVFDVDVFHGRHAGLVIAEIELSSPDEPFDYPPWLGAEVTGEARFSNFVLALQQDSATLPHWPQ